MPNAVMPWCFGTLALVLGRAAGPTASTRRGSSTPSGRPGTPLVAFQRVRVERPGEVGARAPGSENSWHQISRAVRNRREPARALLGQCPCEQRRPDQLEAHEIRIEDQGGGVEVGELAASSIADLLRPATRRARRTRSATTAPPGPSLRAPRDSGGRLRDRRCRSSRAPTRVDRCAAARRRTVSSDRTHAPKSAPSVSLTARPRSARCGAGPSAPCRSRCGGDRCGSRAGRGA